MNDTKNNTKNKNTTNRVTDNNMVKTDIDKDSIPNFELTSELREELSKTEKGKKLILSLEEVEAIRKRLKDSKLPKEAKPVTLKECVDTVNGFIEGIVTPAELENLGDRLSIRGYIPILEKMSMLMNVLLKTEISSVESTEIRMVELYKELFFSIVLRSYAQIQYDEVKDRELLTYDTYDKLFPLFYPYIMNFCKSDYDVFMGMFNDCISWNGVVSIVESLDRVDSDKLLEATESNKVLAESLKENSQLVEGLKDILLATDESTAKAIELIKTDTVRGVLEKGKNSLESHKAKMEESQNKLIDNINFNKEEDSNNNFNDSND